MERRKTDRRPNQAFDQYVIDVRDLVKQVWRRKLLTAILIAVPSIAGFIYLVSMPDRYMAVSSVVLEDNELNFADIKDALPGMVLDEFSLDTQVREIASPTLMRRVIDNLGLKYDDAGNMTSLSLSNKGKAAAAPAKTKEDVDPSAEAAEQYSILSQYAHEFSAVPAKGSRVIELNYISVNPYLSSEIVNAHAKEYVEAQIRVKKEQAEQLNKWVAGQVEIFKKQSTEKAKAVQDFRQEKGMIKGNGADDLIYQQVSDIAAELTPIEARKVDLQARYDGIEAGGKGSAISAIQDSAVIQSMKTQATAARQELRGLSVKYGKNHPLYIEAQRRVSQIEGDLAREKGSIKETLKNELDTVIAQEKLLNDRFMEMKAVADEQRQSQIELQSLEQEAVASSKILDSFISRYDEITSQLNFARPNARVISLSDIPMHPIGAKKPFAMMVILFLSTVFAVLVVFLISFADRGVQSVDDVKQLLKLRMMGVLPDVKNPVAEILNGNRSTYLEEIKRIYLHMANKPLIKTILITAASTGEGKTSMTLALASYLASTGRKTIVVDADILTPDVARLADIADAPGLTEVLTGKAELSSVIYRDARGISIIPAGSFTGGKVDLMTSNKFKSILETLKGNYDYVLVDSAPVLASTDAETVAALVDQVIMVVAYAKTSKKDLKKAAETLRQFAAEVPSVIINKADLKNVA